MEKYDLIIIGAGPAGLTAAIYAGRYMLKTLVIGEIKGGAISEAYEIQNFPSHKSISGLELTNKLIEQTENLGIEIKQEKVEEIKKKEIFEIKTNKLVYSAKKIILANGRKRKKLNVKGEDELIGKGVSYCATCDASFFKEKVVAVAGGSNAALTAALLLAEYAKKVFIIYRGKTFFRAEPLWIKQIESNKKVESIFDSEIKEIIGSEKVKKIILDSDKEIPVDGIFVEIGSEPDPELSQQLGLKTEQGYIITDKAQKTSLEGVFAAGDITNNKLKQAITAAAEGAITAFSAYEEIKKEY